MNLTDIIKRKRPLEPWSCGEKIPWNEPSFSKRMLANHLSQEHDWASRRFEIIKIHVDLIASKLASGARILDLACGPGLYVHELAKRGFFCTGVDFSPASIAYAQEKARGCALDIHYFCSDIRSFRIDGTFDCVLMTFGEFNVFSKEDALALLLQCRALLGKGGLFLLEVHSFEAVRKIGLAPPFWYTSEGGLFSEKPHICLEENGWDEKSRTASTRYFVIDAESGEKALVLP